MSGSHISGMNNFTNKLPSGISGSSHSHYVTAIDFPNLRSLNLYGNNLDARGIDNVIQNVTVSSSWTGNNPQGYINIKDQRNPWGKVVSGVSGLIEILSGRNWIIDYDS